MRFDRGSRALYATDGSNYRQIPIGLLGHLLDEPRFATHEARVEHADELDRAVTGAIASKTIAENVRIIEANALTAVPVQTIADIENDPHWRARRLTLSVPNGATPVRMRNVVPRLSDTPGEIAWAGGTLGADNAEIYNAELGLSGEERSGNSRLELLPIPGAQHRGNRGHSCRRANPDKREPERASTFGWQTFRQE